MKMRMIHLGLALCPAKKSQTLVKEAKLASNVEMTLRALIHGRSILLGIILTITSARSLLQAGNHSTLRPAILSSMHRFSNLTQMRCSSHIHPQRRQVILK